MESRTENGITMITSSTSGQSNMETEADELIDTLFSNTVPEMDLYPVEFVWDLPSGNTHVYLSGSFNQWSERVVMHVKREKKMWNEESEAPSTNPIWHTTILLPPGLHAVRFIVDGKWRISPSLPIHKDAKDNEFNAVYIQPPKKQSTTEHVWVTSPTTLEGRVQTLSNELTFSHLDKDHSRSNDPFLLSFPSPGCEEHFYVSSCHQQNLVSSAVTIRIRQKFVTSQLYHYNERLYTPTSDKT
ncbi:putative Glycogen recognition site of AMP-activated protein kinase [Blattamonas nauphoetae]|uniref:Glycogen recognition site of AMP-activated protein kinase n=1 Tax=Blattamonas nauphoetae TaxID=2049346 RepID=A0ABQ9X6G0_9EUKA|nr:putative Glycogen recognition site of AMP-activated protein kinase [Blattamonas nauphoetae]